MDKEQTCMALKIYDAKVESTVADAATAEISGSNFAQKFQISRLMRLVASYLVGVEIQRRYKWGWMKFS